MKAIVVTDLIAGTAGTNGGAAQVEQPDPLGARQRVPDARELRVESVLERPVTGQVPTLRVLTA